MHRPVRSTRRTLAFAAVLLSPLIASAQSSEQWQYTATINGYLPTIGGKSKFPVDSSGSSVNLDAETILENLKFTFMGSLDIHNGRWGGFTDVLYLDLGGRKSQSRDFTIGDTGIPAGTTADLDYDLKGFVWTLAGEYRLESAPDLKMDALLGARYFALKPKLGYSITGNLGPISSAGRSGSAEIDEDVWDAIIGVKGRYTFGESRKWSVPFYLDVGTGQSDLTWQAAVGVGYAFQWGEVSALWRYLDYKFKSSSKIEDMNFNGPQIGLTFRW